MSEFVGPLDPDVPRFAIDLRGQFPVTARTRNVGHIEQLVVHRLGGPDWPKAVPDLVQALLPEWKKRGLGYACPYWGIIDEDGQLYVIGDLELAMAHAFPNSTLLGLGVVGDFRYFTTRHRQRATLLRTCQWACDRFERGIDFIVGHDETPGCPEGKVCPGPCLDMHTLRQDLADGFGSEAYFS